MLYHGVRRTAGGAIYRLGLALFALATCSISTLLAWLRAHGRPPA